MALTRTTTIHAPGASIASCVCALLWPLSLGVRIIVGMLDHQQLPAALAAMTALCLMITPFIGIICGHIGVAQARRLHATQWTGYVGVSCNYLWLLGICFISEIGDSLLFWATHR